MRYDGILIALYILVLVLIAKELFSMVALTVVIVLLMALIMVQRFGLENLIKSREGERNKKLDDLLVKVEEISKKTDNFKDDVNRQIIFVDNKVADLRHFFEVEIQNFYSDLLRKMAAIEDRLGDVKQTVASAVGSLDERIQDVEKKDEQEEQSEESF